MDQTLQDLLAKVAQALADANAAADRIAKEAYDKGFADGVASVVPGNPDLKFTQADLDKAVADAVGPLNDKIVALQAQVDGIPAQIEEAVGKAKSDIKAQIKALLQTEEADLEAKVDLI